MYFGCLLIGSLSSDTVALVTRFLRRKYLTFRTGCRTFCICDFVTNDGDRTEADTGHFATHYRTLSRCTILPHTNTYWNSCMSKIVANETNIIYNRLFLLRGCGDKRGGGNSTATRANSWSPTHLQHSSYRVPNTFPDSTGTALTGIHAILLASYPTSYYPSIGLFTLSNFTSNHGPLRLLPLTFDAIEPDPHAGKDGSKTYGGRRSALYAA